MLDVRRVAIARFGPEALKPGEPTADLRRKFVPIWLLDRYQVEAAAKLVGGVDFAYAVQGDGREAAKPVPADAQRKALAALLDTLKPSELDVPERLLPLLSSGWSGQNDRQFDIEVFRPMGGPVFDPLAAADAAASVTLDPLLAPARLNRVADQKRRDPAALGAAELVDRLIAATFTPAADEAPRLGDVRRRVATRTALALAATQRDPALSPGVAAELDQRLHDLADKLASAPGRDPSDRAWAKSLGRLLADREALDAELARQPKRKPSIPPGMPIGADEDDWMGPL
jgi:hypothetical protein